LTTKSHPLRTTPPVRSVQARFDFISREDFDLNQQHMDQIIHHLAVRRLRKWNTEGYEGLRLYLGCEKS